MLVADSPCMCPNEGLLFPFPAVSFAISRPKGTCTALSVLVGQTWGRVHAGLGSVLRAVWTGDSRTRGPLHKSRKGTWSVGDTSPGTCGFLTPWERGVARVGSF